MSRRHRVDKPFRTGFGLAAGWSCATIVVLAAVLFTMIAFCGGAGTLTVLGIAKTRVADPPPEVKPEK